MVSRGNSLKCNHDEKSHFSYCIAGCIKLTWLNILGTLLGTTKISLKKKKTKHCWILIYTLIYVLLF